MYNPNELYYRLELFSAGTAVVLDAALLLIVLERINRPFVAFWLKTLVIGTLLFHVGYFGRVMIWYVDSPNAVALDHAMMCSIVAGLLLLPSGILHAAIRMLHTGLQAKPKRDYRYAVLYLPLLVSVPVFTSILSRNDRLFLASIAWITPYYMIWVLSANIAAMGFFLRFATKAQVPFRFSLGSIVALLLVCIGSVAYVVLSRDEQWEPILRLAVCMSPLILEGVFVWYTLKHRVLPLILDRTLLYAVSLIVALLLHQLIVSPVTSLVRERHNIDLSILEAILLIGILLFIPALRKRIREALRYLFSTNVFHVRDALRLLSVSLSQQGNLDPSALSQWFANELAHQLDLDTAIVVLSPEIEASVNSNIFEADPVHNAAAQVRETTTHERSESANKQGETVPEANKTTARSRTRKTPDALDDWVCIARAVQTAERLERGMFVPQSSSLPTEHWMLTKALQAMEQRGILLAFRLSFPTVRGAVLLGDRKRNDRLADEQMISIALLCDQLAATLGNKNESIKRLQVERRMMQNEKLSTLGLIASSLAHELRNPLSSIRTIASLTMEELGPAHANQQDLAIIVSEIDKLSQTTTRLLDSARPAEGESTSVSPDLVIAKLLTLLTPLAKQLHVELRVSLSSPDALVPSSEASMSEVFFNLIKNAIEAATGRPNAWVQVASSIAGPSSLCVVVSDNGPGIDEALQQCLFEPFMTGKTHGTGLGLFVVSERIKEIHGSIACKRNEPANSTEFEVTLPICGKHPSE